MSDPARRVPGRVLLASTLAAAALVAGWPAVVHAGGGVAPGVAASAPGSMQPVTPTGPPARRVAAAATQDHEEADPQAEHAAEGEHEEGFDPWTALAKGINFILLSGLLWWALVETPPFIEEIFAFPGLRTVLADRKARIVEAKALAAEQRQQAEKIVDESRSRLSRIEQEVEDLIEQAKQDAAREKERSEEEAEAQAEKVRETAKRELRAETLGAQRELRTFVADLAVGMAARTIDEQLTAADQERLMKDYLSRLGARVG